MGKVLGSMKIFLSSASKESMARLALTWSLVLASFMFVVMSFYISYSLYKGLPIEWYGLSTFVGSLSSFIGVTVWGKVVQRKYEGNNGYDYNNGNGSWYNPNGGGQYSQYDQYGNPIDNNVNGGGNVIINNIAKKGKGISTGPDDGSGNNEPSV